MREHYINGVRCKDKTKSNPNPNSDTKSLFFLDISLYCWRCSHSRSSGGSRILEGATLGTRRELMGVWAYGGILGYAFVN